MEKNRFRTCIREVRGKYFKPLDLKGLLAIGAPKMYILFGA